MTNSRSEYFWEGAILSVANARDLLDAAAESAGSGRFGVASSLAILCAEECAKANGLLARALSESDDTTTLKQYFTSHRVKHEVGSAVLTMFRITERLHSIASKVALDKSIADEEKDSHLISRISEWSDAEVNGRENCAEDIAAWKKDADRVKQNGFYVDRVGDGWHSPASIGECEYVSRRDYALQFLEILESIVAYGSLPELRQLFNRAMRSRKNDK